MVQQIPLPRSACGIDASHDAERGDATHAVCPDVAYRRLGIVNVIFVGPPAGGDRGWVLVDAGLPLTAGLIRSAARRRLGAGSRPAAIVLTHGHFDHIGALAWLARDWDVPVYAHSAEHPYLLGQAAYPPADPSVGGGLMSRMSRLYPRGPIDMGPTLQPLPSDGSVPAMPGWRWIGTPGHSVGHVSFWREADRILIAGDAVVTTAQESMLAVAGQRREMHGPPMYYTVDWDAAKRSVIKLSTLEPEILVSGHGIAMRGPQMRAALRRLAEDFDAVARPRAGIYLERPAQIHDGSAYRTP